MHLPFFKLAWKLESFVGQANKSKAQTTNWGGYVLKLLKQARLTPDMDDFLNIQGPSKRFNQQVVSVLLWVLWLLLVTWRGSSWHEDLQAGIPSKVCSISSFELLVCRCAHAGEAVIQSLLV